MCFTKILSPAKVNLTLNILGTREDGYHLIKSIFQPIDLFDEVSIKVEEGEGIELNNMGLKVPTDESNLAFKAAMFYLDKSSTRKKVIIDLDKKIPIGSGLGGGSGNAASVLVGLNKLLKRLSDNQLLEIAENLGADVPFFIRSVTSLVQGIGENITLLSDFPLFHYVILFPRINISSKKVYDEWDNSFGETNDNIEIEELVKQFENNEVLPLTNDLEKPAFKLHPELESFKDIFYSLDCKLVLMSGSGSSIFAVFRTEREANELYEYLNLSSSFDIFQAKGIKGWHYLID